MINKHLYCDRVAPVLAVLRVVVARVLYIQIKWSSTDSYPLSGTVFMAISASSAVKVRGNIFG